MRINKQNNLTRELAGLLLTSSLSEKQLADLCHDILNNGTIINEVAINILNLINHRIDNSFERKSNYPERTVNEATSAYNWLKNKGITKDKLFYAFSVFNSNVDDYITQSRPTMKGALEYFIETSSKSEFNHFMSSFSDDEFIQMIEDR